MLLPSFLVVRQILPLARLPTSIAFAKGTTSLSRAIAQAPCLMAYAYAVQILQAAPLATRTASANTAEANLTVRTIQTLRAYAEGATMSASRQRQSKLPADSAFSALPETVLVPKEAAAKKAKNRPEGYLADLQAASHWQSETSYVLTREAYDALVAKYQGLPPPPPLSGPGAELKKLLKAIGIVATPNCSCNARARTMDANGIEWCEANIDTIVGWLREEATKRKLPFVDMAGRLLVKRAIRNARKAAS
jgi:hypothetical protein